MGFSKTQCVAITGAAATMAGGAILGAFNGVENFVLGEMEGVQACSDNPIGQVGLFKSSLSFECTTAPGVPDSIQAQYASQKPLDSVPTTEYWPLFPSPNVFGFSPEQQAAIVNSSSYPYDDIDFNTCAEYHTAGNVTSTGGKGWQAIRLSSASTAGMAFGALEELAPTYTDFTSPEQTQALCTTILGGLGAPTTACQTVSTFPEFVTLLNNIVSQLPDVPAAVEALLVQVNALNQQFVEPCIAGNVTTVAACKGAFMDIGTLFGEGLMQAMYDSLMSVNNTGTVFETDIYVNKCKDQLKDQDAVEKGQILVPIGTAATLIGALIMAVGAGKAAKNLLYAGSAFGIVGAILGLVALLGVQGAPVYALVGAPAAQYDIVYVSGTGGLLSLIGVALGFLGPITSTVAACLMKVEQAHELEVDPAGEYSSKV